MQTAIVTASYRADFQRCLLLCDSIDRHVAGHTAHFILVERADVALFSRLAGPRRIVVDERALLPAWLRPFPDPRRLGRRRIWLSPKGPPLGGWHVQQLRKIAFAAQAREDAVLFCDSDTAFFRPTDLSALWSGEAFAFYARPRAIRADMPEHAGWSARAGQLLGLPAPSAADYIAQSVGWRTDTARGMAARIEAVSGRSWVAAIAARRRFSEYMIYGRYVDEVEGRPERHAASATPICLTQWNGVAMSESGLKDFVRLAAPMQTIVGFQSFIGTDIELIRRVIGF